MDDLKLREALRPLANALTPASALDAERKVREGFRSDGLIDIGVIAGALPAQRFDLVVPGGATAGVQPARFFIPEASRGVRLALISSGNASDTFGVDVRVNGTVRASGAIRSGTNQSTGVFSVALPTGSVVSIETKATITQAVTVTVFYRPVED